MAESDRAAALLGRIAVKHRFITMEQLAEATLARGRHGQKLGAILVELGMIDELQLGKILALQKRYVEQLQADEAKSRAIGRVKKMPTPNDWVVAARQKRTKREELPRGGRRTPEVDAQPPEAEGAVGEWTGEAREMELPVDQDDVVGPATDREPPRTFVARSSTPVPARPMVPTTPSATSDAPPVSPRSAAPAACELAPVALGTEPEPPSLEPRPASPPAEITRRLADLHRFFEAAAQAMASDVHVHAGMPLEMRRFGHLVAISDKPLSPEATDRVLRDMLSPWQRAMLDDHGEVDFAYAVEGVGRFRANVYRHLRGTNGVFHFVRPSPPTLEELGLPTTLARLTNFAQGLILVTGPAGCGKTSTLAALIDIINTERRDHILTIEDPIEYLHPSKRCVVNQRQVGRHTTTFARALRGALREDPDVICIGELRDLETISLALSAAETGHLVLATLHTGSSIGTINRIVGAYPPGQQPQVRAMMSESLRAILSQRLVPRADGEGVVPALEILYVNKAVGACIRDNRTFQINSVLQTGKAHGMQRLEDALAELVRRGIISTRAARDHGAEGGP